MGLNVPLPLVHGPFLYLYTYQQTTDKPFQIKQLLHFVPLFLMYVIFWKYFAMTREEQLQVFQQQGKGFEIQSAINMYLIYASGIVYVTLSLLRLLRYRRMMVQQFSNTEKINFNWLLYLIVWMVIIWLVVLVVRDDKLIFGVASLFVLWIGYFGIKQVQVFTQRTPLLETDPAAFEKNQLPLELPLPVVGDTSNNLKYQKSTLTDENASDIHNRLLKMLEVEQPYKDPDLTLNDLADKLHVHPNYLSQVINSKENKTFYDLINEKRVIAFIEKTSEASSQQYTFLAIALDCGFNSKASFNRNFKKFTGQTPSEYLQAQSMGHGV